MDLMDGNQKSKDLLLLTKNDITEKSCLAQTCLTTWSVLTAASDHDEKDTG